MSLKIGPCRDFPGGPAHETSLSDSEALVSSQGAGTPTYLVAENQGATLANSIKTLKNRPRQKNFER